MNDLILNIDKLHTTPMGAMRIRRNLAISIDDVVEYCRGQILLHGAIAKRHGKNWYVSTQNCTITINASSFTVITAYKSS